MKDSDIISLLWKRAENAIDALAKAYGRRLYLMAMNILDCHQDAEECVDDTYLAVWNVIPPQKPDPLAGFVYKIGRNTALNRLRFNQAQKRSSRYDLSLEELAGCIPGPALEEYLDARELGRSIDRFLAMQSRDNRVIFLRRYWFGDSLKDIAAVTGLSENAVAVRLSRIREKLKDHFIKEERFHA